MDFLTVATSAYGYPADSNRLSNVTQGAVTLRSFGYDAAGNITANNRAGANTTYFYNDRGRLKQTRLGNVVQANYHYDVFERLNWRQTLNMTPAGITHYIQDLEGRLIVEASETGTMLREYIWIDDMPLAVFADLDTATPQLYYVHPDHLNRPLRMTDESQAVVWDAVYKPFGEVFSLGGSATLNLRFPGQYFLIESGLAYNWHRHYDASLGRYTQPDPLGDAVHDVVSEGNLRGVIATPSEVIENLTLLAPTELSTYRLHLRGPATMTNLKLGHASLVMDQASMLTSAPRQRHGLIQKDCKLFPTSRPFLARSSSAMSQAPAVPVVTRGVV